MTISHAGGLKETVDGSAKANELWYERELRRDDDSVLRVASKS